MPVKIKNKLDDEDRTRLTILYNRYLKLMLKIANNYINNRDDADDIVHGVFLNIICNKNKLLPMPCDVLRRYIIVMVKNKCIDFIRSKKRFKTEPLHIYENVLMSDTPDENSMTAGYADTARIKKAMDGLDDTSRNCFKMKYAGGLTYKEIAANLRISEKCVEMKIMRAKSKLKRLLE